MFDDDPPEEDIGPDIPSIDHPIMEEPDPEAKYDDMIPSIDEPSVDTPREPQSSEGSTAFGAAVLLANLGLLVGGIGVLLVVFEQMVVAGGAAIAFGLLCGLGVVLLTISQTGSSSA